MKDQTLNDHEKLIKEELKLGIELHMELEREDACDKILKLIHKQNKALLLKERERMIKEIERILFEKYLEYDDTQTVIKEIKREL